MKTPNRIRKGQTVYFWCSASEVAEVKFVRWERARMKTGREDTNKIGVAAVVSSQWRFSRVLLKRPQRGLKRGQYRIRPYTEIYRTDRNARMHRREIKRPAVDDVRPR